MEQPPYKGTLNGQRISSHHLRLIKDSVQILLCNINSELWLGKAIIFLGSCRLPRYILSAPLVADKLVSIIALLGLYDLPAGTNPLRRIALFLLHKVYLNEDNESLPGIDFHQLNSQDYMLLLSFATSLIEQVSRVNFSQQDRFHMAILMLIVE